MRRRMKKGVSCVIPGKESEAESRPEGSRTTDTTLQMTQRQQASPESITVTKKKGREPTRQRLEADEEEKTPVPTVASSLQKSIQKLRDSTSQRLGGTHRNITSKDAKEKSQLAATKQKDRLVKKKERVGNG